MRKSKPKFKITFRDRFVDAVDWLYAQVLRWRDTYENTHSPAPGIPPASAIDKLRKRDIPREFLHRAVVDIGCGNGNKYGVIRSLFRPKSYWGLDNDFIQVREGWRRQLDIRLIDFVKDRSIRGDLGLMIGTYTTPTTAGVLSKRFKALFFNDHAQNEKGAAIIKGRYEHRLGKENLKVIIRPDKYGWMMLFFYKPRHERIHTRS